MGSGKSGGGSKDYYGHAAFVLCQGQLDFIWGLMLENELAWPTANLWDSSVHKKGKTVIYYDGNVYRASAVTNIDPPAFPWIQIALPWHPGAYLEGDMVLKNGYVWLADSNTSGEPPDAPTQSQLNLAVKAQTPVNGWVYVSTPQQWVTQAANPFWPGGSIVAWKGRIYTTPAATKAEPPAAPWTLFRIDRATSPNPLKFTVADRGDAYLYWGTADQQLDADGEEILSALGHPPYRHRAVLVLKDFLFGTMQTTAPSPVVLAGRAPVQNLIAGAATAMDADWQVNPWCVLVEKLTHPVFGLGLPLSWFNQASFQAEADWCYQRSNLTYISPMYTSLKKVRALVAELLGYPDAFIFWSTIATLVAGHWPHGEAIAAFDATNTIDMHDIVSPIATNSDGWGGTSDSVAVSFNDIQGGFKARPVAATSLFNRTITRRMQSTTIERPHIVRAGQAAAWAAELAKIEGEQSSKGMLTVRAEKAKTIKPGSLFLLTDDTYQTSEVQRCTSRVISAPPAGTIKLTHETERGVSPQPYSPTPQNPTENQGPSPAAITNAIFVQLPSSLSGGINQMVCLAERRNEFTSSFETWFQKADADAFQQLATQDSFAVPGVFAIETSGSELNDAHFNNHLTQMIGPIVQGQTYQLNAKNFWFYQVFSSDNANGFPPDVPFPVEGEDYAVDPATGQITIIAGGVITTGKYVQVKMTYAVVVTVSDAVAAADLEALFSTLTEDQIEDGALLLFAFKADEPSQFEIMKVRFVVASSNPGGNRIGVGVRRAQFGTLQGGDGAYEFTTADPCFIVFKAGLKPFTHEAFDGLIKANSSAKFRVSPRSAWVQADVNDVYDLANNPAGLTTEYNVGFSNVLAPRVTWVQLQQNGADIADLADTFLTTDVFTFNFDVVDINNDLAQATLIASLGQQELTLWSQVFENAQSVNRTVQFSLPTPGYWRIALNARDSAGNSATYPLTPVGGGDEAQLHIEPPATATAPSPIIYNYTAIGNYIYNLDFGWLPPATTVKWQLKNKGVAHDPTGGGGWTVAAAHGAAGGPGGTYRLYGPVTPAFRKGTKTLYAFCHQAGHTDSPVVHWNL